MRLTTNFKLEEFTHSYLLGGHLAASPLQIERVHRLCVSMLEPLRAEWGPIRIASGIRNDKVYYLILEQARYLRAHGNDAPLPSQSSDHFAGDPICPNGTGAADLVFLKGDAADLALLAFEFLQGVDWPFKQCIFYPDKAFIHVSNAVIGVEPRRECKIYKNGEYTRVR